MSIRINPKNWFRKSEEEPQARLPKHEIASFELKIDDVTVGWLTCQNGIWKFRYDEGFKQHTDQYNLMIGFSELGKTYTSETLWPFFQIRIPGLNQPLVREILEKENIEKDNEVALLKRFGRVSIANPYVLNPA